ncbi:MAG TPA: AraC family ligand binding domain-containing protein [Polyangia bacterium]|jgi:quercetin dioxygenase-like cupin family protein
MAQETSPAPRAAREPHPVTGKALTFSLAAEAEQLMREPTWQAHGHNAKTLVKHPDFRVVLIALRAGSRMPEHKTDHCVTIHALEGKLRLHLPGSTLDLGRGELLALEQTVLHDIEAVADSVFVLSLGWSASATAGT